MKKFHLKQYHEISSNYCTKFALLLSFLCHEWKLTKFRKYLTKFPSCFSHISQNFDGILLFFHSISMYFVNFRLCFQCFQKLTAKFWSHSDWFKISDLAMAKVEKVNIAVIQLSITNKLKILLSRALMFLTTLTMSQSLTVGSLPNLSKMTNVEVSWLSTLNWIFKAE